jgi:hypothetical protein
MAIIITGKSRCPICNEIINESDDIVMFPPFIQNVNDPFYIFNDAGVHSSCLLKHQLGNQALEYREVILEKTKPENRICDIGGNVITKPDDYIFIDLLTSDVSEELSKFNFMTIDKNNLSQWQERQLFHDTAHRFIDEGKWKSLTDFNYLLYLVDQTI